MRFTKFNRLLALLAVLSSSLLGQAFTLIPISATLAPKGYGVGTTFRVENESSNRIAFQISMVTRDMNEQGEETQKPAGDLFTVFPPQGVVGPGQRQNIRVAWKGPQNPTNELAFRIVAEQLPVNFEPQTKESQIKLLVRYLGTVYIRPKNAKPKLETVALTKSPDNSATNNLYELTLNNAGNAHQGLENCVLTVTDANGQKTVLKSSQLDKIEGQNILANHRRRFPVTLPADLSAEDYHAEIQVDE